MEIICSTKLYVSLKWFFWTETHRVPFFLSVLLCVCAGAFVGYVVLSILFVLVLNHMCRATDFSDMVAPGSHKIHHKLAQNLKLSELDNCGRIN